MFYLKEKSNPVTSIEVIVSISGKKLKYATGESVQTEFWKGRRAEYSRKHPAGKQINEKLDKIEKAVTLVVGKLKQTGTAPDNSTFKKLIVEQLTGQPKSSEILVVDYLPVFIDESSYKPASLKKFNSLRNLLIQYEADNRTKIRLADVGPEFYISFKSWFFSQKAYTRNYFGALIKALKRVMSYSLENKIHQNIRFKNSVFVVEAETAQSVYLSTDELMRIASVKFTSENVLPITKGKKGELLEAKIKSLEKCRDRFLVGAFTGLRVSDFNRLDHVHVDGNFLRITAQKTAAPLVIPLHPVVTSIIGRGGLEYRISEQKINKHIKEVCYLAGITQPVTFTRHEGNRLVEHTSPKNKLVTTHTARRSAATNMFKAGIPAISIMKITGHTTEKSFLKYIRISNEENAELLAAHPFFNQSALLQ